MNTPTSTPTRTPTRRRLQSRTPRIRPTARLHALLVLALSLALLPLLAGCGVHPGGAEIAYLRGGALWVINPDGSNARVLAAGPVAGFAWSPDHHMLVSRGESQAAEVVPPPGSPLGTLDAPGNLTVVSINGGAGVTITPNLAGIARSDAWWDTTGNRLLYREEPAPVNPAAYAPSYVVSQNDQPVGIARKFVYDAAGLPMLAPDGSRVAVIDPDGNVRVGPPGQQGAIVASGALLTLPGSNRPGRVLWQPAHDALLYAALPSSPSQPATGSTTVALVLHSLTPGAQTRTLTTIDGMLDVAFSPDGSHLLIHDARSILDWNIARGRPDAVWSESDPAAQVWQAPDGRAVLIQDTTGLRLGEVATGKLTTLLAYATPLDDTLPQAPLWTPADASPWSGDGTAFDFVAPPAATWQGHPLPQASATSGTGLYAVTVANGTPGTPKLLTSGAVSAPSWSYLAPSATFLRAA